MITSASLISQLAVQSQTNTSNYVVLDNIMEGVDGAGSFGYSVSPRAVRVQDAQTQQYAFDHTLDVRVLRSSDADLAKLQFIEANQEPVKATARGIDGSVLFYDEALMVRAPQMDQVLADRFLITRTSGVGYLGDAPSSRQSAIGGIDDLMRVFDTSTGSASLLNGLSDDAATVTQAGGVQSITRISTGGFSRVLSPTFLWPFPGTILEAEIEVTASSTSNNHLLLIEARDISGSISSLNVQFTTTGIKKISLTMPSGTVYVQFYVNAGATTGESLSFKNPVLRLIK